MEMEQIDLESMFSASTMSSWMLPAFDQQDANFLSGSRQMLEPIIEETSEDEESSIQSYSSSIHQCQYGNLENGSQLSSESDTGSVIRVEVHNDQDSISERDFLCPAKRARRDLENSTNASQTQNNIYQFQNFDSPKNIRKFQRNDTQNEISGDYLAPFNTNYRKRFEEFLYSDSDSQSYHSLSRSSSLIQFESLERQLQSDLLSSGSSPSLLSFVEESTQFTNRGSSGSLKRFESSDGRLHQTYLDLDKIDFDKNTNIIFNNKDSKSSRTESNELWDKREQTLEPEVPRNELRAISEERRSSKSDSDSSSDASILSHEERVLAQPKQAFGHHVRNGSFRSKNSTENLSEDSGYSEHYTLRAKSKSISNLMSEKFSEEEENRKSPEEMYKKQQHSMEQNFQQHHHHNEKLKIENQWLNGQVKNKTQHKNISSTSLSDDDQSLETALLSRKINNKVKQNTQENLSASLPDVREEHSDNLTVKNRGCDAIFKQFDLAQVSSVPSELNLLGGPLDSPTSEIQSDPSSLTDSFERKYSSDKNKNSTCSCGSDESDDIQHINWINKQKDNSQNRILAKRRQKENIKRHSFEFCDFLENSPKNSFYGVKNTSSSGLTYASYNNLTLLDYSDSSTSLRNINFKMSKSKDFERNSKEFDRHSGDFGSESRRDSRAYKLGRGNFLLDEISAHFDKNVSILSDRHGESDLVSEFLNEELKQPPCPPQRRSSKSSVLTMTEETKRPPRHNNETTKEVANSCTFDLDPTNLKTSYAESLERCNFDPSEQPSQTILDKIKSVPVGRFSRRLINKRGLVSSTPNLNEYSMEKDDDDDMKISSTSTSMQQLPQEKKAGILLASGSRNSLAKSVNFHPIVAEYTWHEKSEETYEPDSLENLSHENTVKNETVVYNPNSNIHSDGCYDVIDAYNNDNTTTQLNKNKNIETERLLNEQQELNEYKNQERIQLEQQHQRKEPMMISKVMTHMLPTTFLLPHNNNNEITNKHFSTTSTNSNLENKQQISEFSNKTIVNEFNSLTKNNNGAGEKIIKNINGITMINGDTAAGGDDDDDLKKQIKSSEKLINNEKLLIKNNYKNNNNNYNKNNSKNSNIYSSSSSGSNKSGNTKKQNNMMLSTTVPMNQANNNELLNQKFKPKPDEKRHKPFLSRFTGFRFSLRKKSPNKHLQHQQKQQPIIEITENIKTTTAAAAAAAINNTNNASSGKKKSIADGAVKSKQQQQQQNQQHQKQQHSGTQHSKDFIYIPLKGSVPPQNNYHQYNGNNGTIASAATNSNGTGSGADDSLLSNRSTLSGNSLNNNHMLNIKNHHQHEEQFYSQKNPSNNNNTNNNNINNNNNNNNVLRGKPPLPKQPPRVVGVSEKVIQQLNQRAGQHAPIRRSFTSTANDNDTSINKNFLENERGVTNNYQFDDYQFNETMNGNGHINSSSTPIKRYQRQDGASSNQQFYAPPPPEFDDDDNDNDDADGDFNIHHHHHRYQKQQQQKKQHQQHPIDNGNNNNNGKIGLIETNLDTHETIITGKTQSLMELGPNNKSRILNKHNKIKKNIIDDDDDDDDIKEHNGAKTTTRRPHKSMEFLLDKENQEKVLVSEQIIFKYIYF